MKNQYEVRGDIAVIFLRRRDGTVLETKIDVADLERVKELPGRWHAYWHPDTQSFYVKGPIMHENGRKTTVRLHRWILQTAIDLEVDHRDHDTLNNLRLNLREVTASENKQNIKGALKSNRTSGIRGVCWDKHNKKWKAAIRLKGRHIHLGNFDDLTEAADAVKKARSSLMPYSVMDAI
ncbi:AP2 domain-containing protein [Paenibacillus sp. GYB004]|uniref:AP2 domain-containing protein n=1 Tax=Paenibacillus sp. GYB004 TaxID=2994393 RepID=UPI002F96226D